MNEILLLGRIMWILALDPSRIPTVLRVCGIKEPTEALWHLLFMNHPKRWARRLYAGAILAQFFVVAPSVAFLIATAFWHLIPIVGQTWPWAARLARCLEVGSAVGCVGGLGVGLAVCIVRYARNRHDALWGLCSGIAVGLCSGLLTGYAVALGLGGNSAFPQHVPLSSVLIAGCIIGFAVGSIYAQSLNAVSYIASQPMRGRYAAFSIPLAAVVGCMMMASKRADWHLYLAATVSVGAASLLFLVQSYPIYAVWQTVSFVWQRIVRTATLGYTPARLTPSSYLPLPFLGYHIRDTALIRPAEALRTIRVTLRSPGLRRQGMVALARLQATEIAELVRISNFRSLSGRTGFWIRLAPERFGNREILEAFATAAMHIVMSDMQEGPECLLTLALVDEQLCRLISATFRSNSVAFRVPLRLLRETVVRRKAQRSRALTLDVIEQQTPFFSRPKLWSMQSWAARQSSETAIIVTILVVVASALGLSANRLFAIKNPDQIATAIVQVWVQLVAFVTLTVSAYFSRKNFQAAKDTAQLNQERQFHEIFNEASKSLGHDDISVRQGAVLALERLGVDSDRDFRRAMELLASHVRSQCKVKGATARQLSFSREPEMQPDADAAFRALCQRRVAPSSEAGARIDLCQCDLRQVCVPGARLAEALLRDANFDGADLSFADLRGADLSRASFHNARLIGADLRGANLRQADFNGAELDLCLCDSLSLNGLKAPRKRGRNTTVRSDKEQQMDTELTVARYPPAMSILDTANCES